MAQFFIQWFWYLVAFAAGALVAWLVATRTIEARSEDEAFVDLTTTQQGAVR